MTRLRVARRTFAISAVVFAVNLALPASGLADGEGLFVVALFCAACMIVSAAASMILQIATPRP